MKRKLTLILICAAFLVALCVLFCVSASAETYSGDCGANGDGFVTQNGTLYYYENGKVKTGWFEVDGKTYYGVSTTGVCVNADRKISGKQYFWNDETGLTLADGFHETENGTLCFENGVQVIGWRHADGSGPSIDANGVSEQYSNAPNSLYYFLSSTGFMVTDSTYTLGGYSREFNADHTVKPLNGLQNRYGELYYYIEGVIQTGWHTVDGNTYYFRASDAVYGRAATKWMYIGDKLYYFYASTSATPYALKTSGTIGGITYQYAEDGQILCNGFVNTDYSNANNNNTDAYIHKMNGTTRYLVKGETQYGWQQIDGNHYYFYAKGSANGSGNMCTESRTIGGVWYDFNENGVRLDPPAPEEPVLPDNLILVTDQRDGHEGIAVIDLSKIDLTNYNSDLDYALIPEEAEVFRYSGSIYDAAGVKIRKSDALGGYVILVAYGSRYASIISYPDGKQLFQTSQTGRGPHSVELLPEGWLVVAAPGNSSSSYSDGSLTFFNANPGTGSATCRLSITLPNAHGVLYDPEGNCIWAVGNNLLKKYTYTITDGQISVEEVLSETIPKSGAHDLSAFYGNADKLLITTSSYVYVYTKSSGTFKRASSSQSLVTSSKVKGYGLLQDGSVVFSKPGAVYADSVSQTWLTDCIYYYKKTEDGLIRYRLVTTSSEYYKVRVMCAEYQ